MTVPTKWQLARHWEASPNRNTFAPMLEDLKAPCCFACGWFSEHWSKATPKASWERATLERAHIVPSSLGGSDDASNVILLCALCHRDSPDWHDPSEMARWIAERPERCSAELEEFADWFGAAQQVPEFVASLERIAADPDLPTEVAVQRIKDQMWESARKASLHASTLSSGTKVAILRDVAGEVGGPVS